MKVTDLTHSIYEEMPVFPGTEQPILERANTLEKDGFQEAKITMYSHTGTHIDAPAHMLSDGSYLDDLKIDHLFVIIKTGWDKHWGNEKYYEDFPSLSVEAAAWLSEFNLKGIGIDAISIEDI